MQYLRVNNLPKYQHYSKRNPPWVKLYREFLSDYTLRTFPAPTRLLFACCLLLASETENRIPFDYGYLSARVGMRVSAAMLAPLLSSTLLCLFSDSSENSNMLAESTHDASAMLAPARLNGKGKRAIGEEDHPTDKHFELGKILGVEVGPEWGKFKNYCLAHDKRYANFEAAFRNWIARAQEMKIRQK